VLQNADAVLPAHDKPPNGTRPTNNPKGTESSVDKPRRWLSIVLDEMKNLKTAWEYYNEATEIIDRERERDWIEQMDTILVFVRPRSGI
jgi:hypothetical protein